MSSRQTIHDAIGDIVDGISTSIIPVKYRYPESSPTQFPATFTLFRGSPPERKVDTITNEVIYNFAIVTVYPIDESATGYQKWLLLYDTLTDELRKDDYQTLSGNAIDFMVETNGQPVATEEFAQPCVMLDIRVTAKVLKSITA